MIQIAESVTAQLNSASFSQTFTAKRLYVPNFDLEELSELHVSVVPRDVVLAALDRLTNRYNVRIDIAVQQKFESGANAEIDPLLNLIEEISDLFRLKRLGSLANVDFSHYHRRSVLNPEWQLRIADRA